MTSHFKTHAHSAKPLTYGVNMQSFSDKGHYSADHRPAWTLSSHQPAPEPKDIPPPLENRPSKITDPLQNSKANPGEAIPCEPSPHELQVVNEEPYLSSSGKRKFTESEKFELLSAYLDDEVSELERQLVEQWLCSDGKLKAHYQAQLKLRQSIQRFSGDLFQGMHMSTEATADSLPNDLSDDSPRHFSCVNSPPSFLPASFLPASFLPEKLSGIRKMATSTRFSLNATGSAYALPAAGWCSRLWLVAVVLAGLSVTSPMLLRVLYQDFHLLEDVADLQGPSFQK